MTVVKQALGSLYLPSITWAISHPQEGLRRFKVVEAGTRVTFRIAVDHGEHHQVPKPTRDAWINLRLPKTSCTIVVSFGPGLMKRSPDFFVVDDASLVVAASQFALGEECVEGLAAWHG
jgi:hypothetical protein